MGETHSGRGPAGDAGTFLVASRSLVRLRLLPEIGRSWDEPGHGGLGSDRWGMGSATAARRGGDGAAVQSRRRSGCSAGTSTMQIRTPSGSATHISSSPHGSRLGSRRTRTPTPGQLPPHHGQLTHLQPQRHTRGRRRGSAARQLQEPTTQEEHRPPVRPAAEFAVDRQPPARPGRRPGCAPGRSGAAARGCSTPPWRHDHPTDAPWPRRLP
jgi:hypothetical protein